MSSKRNGTENRNFIPWSYRSVVDRYDACLKLDRYKIDYRAIADGYEIGGCEWIRSGSISMDTKGAAVDVVEGNRCEYDWPMDTNEFILLACINHILSISIRTELKFETLAPVTLIIVSCEL